MTTEGAAEQVYKQLTTRLHMEDQDAIDRVMP